jgi:predicted esterase YcpF (UPF0227 family)
MILYISGLNSSYKSYIKTTLDSQFKTDCSYYVIQGDFQVDMKKLLEIVDGVNEVFVIGHSTGGFYGLTLFRMVSNVICVNLINPAIDLTWSINKNNPTNHFDTHQINKVKNDNDLYYKDKVFPIYCYQGLDDDRVNVEYNRLFIKKCSGTIDLISAFGHRFSEIEFKTILSRIHNNFLEPDF